VAVPQVIEFMGTAEYIQLKARRFPAEDFEIPIRENKALLVKDVALRDEFRKRHEATKAPYYRGQPPFDDLLKRIHHYIENL